MEYVKVIGDSHADALKKLREVYGNEAMIYYEKEIPAKTVLSRMVGKKQFLIQAAIKEKKGSAMNSSLNTAKGGPLLRKDNNISREAADKIIPVKVHEVHIDNEVKKDSSPLPVKGGEKKGQSSHIGEEFLALLEKSGISDSKEKFNLEEISIEKKHRTAQKPALAASNGGANEAAPQVTLNHLQSELSDIKEKISILIKSPTYSEHKNEIDRLKENLFEQDFSPQWISDCIQAIKQSLPQADWNVATKIYMKARDIIASKIKVNPSINSRRVIVLLGPTGVGKTTTVAKLAARLKLQENRRVTLITLDNYRIAATEQLKVYGDIMDIPVFVIKDPEKFKAKIHEDSADYILVDTTGFSHNNLEFLAKQKSYFEDVHQEIDKHLVLAGTSKLLDANHVIEKFSEYSLNRIILSKVDETLQVGGFVELAEKWDLPFSFYTNGQRVPDDYLPADKNYLAEKILFRLKEKCLFST